VKRCLQILLLSSLAALLGLELRQPSWQQQPDAQRPTSDRPQNYLPLGPEVEFLIEVGVNSQLGGQGAVLRKWAGELRIGLFGNVTRADRQAAVRAARVLDETVGALRVRIDQTRPNVEIHIIAPESFGGVVPKLRGRSRNVIWCDWNSRSQIRRAWLLIDWAQNEPERAGRIHELLLRALGLMGDSFQQWPTVLHRNDGQRVARYSEMDLKALRILYDPLLLPGMVATRVREVWREAGRK